MKFLKGSGRPQGKLWARRWGGAARVRMVIERKVGQQLLGRSSFHVLIIHLQSEQARPVILEM